jgi:hypothetical protein
MPSKTFIVPVRTFTTEILRVKAESKEEAMDAALDDENCELIEVIDGDPEVYYPDIREERS